MEPRSEQLILVDEHDEPVGVASRAACHAGLGLRHRAFVVFLFDDRDRLLLQRRAAHKLGGGRWDVSATSHVRAGESYTQAAARCLRHELGIDPAPVLERVLAYVYTERLAGQSENEYCVLFRARYTGDLVPHGEEIDALRFQPLDEVARDIAARPEDHTAWLREAVGRLAAGRP